MGIVRVRSERCQGLEHVTRQPTRDVAPRAARRRSGDRCGVAALPRAFAQPEEPLRIGFLTVRTGPLAAGGRQREEGAALFLKERSATLAGRKIELIVQDTAGTPALAKSHLHGLCRREPAAIPQAIQGHRTQSRRARQYDQHR